MSIAEKLAALFRRRPPTEEEIEAKAEAKLLRAQMTEDRISQDSKAGMVYRSRNR